MKVPAELLIFLLTLAFAAGGFAAGHALALRTARREINGLGGRLNRAVLALVHICPTESREEVMRIILGAERLGESKGRSS